MDLALVIPFHNEDRYLARLIRSLREQSVQNVPIVFIDNASTDRSVAVVQACEEVRTGKWWCIEERKVGKFHAMKTALAFCRERFGESHVGFVDADCYLSDNSWVLNNLEIVEGADGRFGYSYSPTRYVGFDSLPIFKAAYLAYERVLEFIMKNVGWFGNGQGFVCSADTLTQYFQKAEITTELDFRCSLLALFNGRQAYLNPSVVVSSGRRMVVNATNFSAWCFYHREFYSKKDINAEKKLDLKISIGVKDLQPSMVKQFFERRALKMSARNLIPLAIFGRESPFPEKIRSVLGIDVFEGISAKSKQFRETAEWLLTDQFETMIQLIERDRAAIALAQRLASLMCERYNHSLASATNLHAV